MERAMPSPNRTNESGNGKSVGPKYSTTYVVPALSKHLGHPVTWFFGRNKISYEVVGHDELGTHVRFPSTRDFERANSLVFHLTGRGL